MSSASELRRQLRQQRRELSALERERCDQLIVRHVLQSGLFKSPRHTASYLAQDGEASLDGLHAELWRRRQPLYLPVLRDDGRLRFDRFQAGTGLVLNRFGIPEPQQGRYLPPRFLNVVLMPLVGFDDRGHRLGMGGGFYDRTFAFSRSENALRRPRLIGVAYERQRCECLEANPWDVPLDGVLTEAGLQLFQVPANSK